LARGSSLLQYFHAIASDGEEDEKTMGRSYANIFLEKANELLLKPIFNKKRQKIVF
jgi:hypothetical protein